MNWMIPKRLAESCSHTPERQAWLAQLPRVLDELTQRWSLTLEPPFDGAEVSCSWVARAIRGDGTPAVLKLGMPHMEATHELHGLRFWAGEPTVHLLAAEEVVNALLLEACQPGVPLRTLPEPEQDLIIAGLLRRLWRTPPQPHPFRPLAVMTAAWAAETEADQSRWRDPGLVRAGLQLFQDLPRSASTQVLLATDLHAGNVLRAQRQPWLVIDPKPFVGDPAYDATQHLLNCRERLTADPVDLLHRFADLLQVDAERVRLWLFARLTAEQWSAEGEWGEVARQLGG